MLFADCGGCVSTGSTTRAGVDSFREQKKLEARKMLINSHLSKRSEGVHALLGGDGLNFYSSAKYFGFNSNSFSF